MEIFGFILANLFWIIILAAISGLILLPLYLFRWLPNRRITNFKGRLLGQVNHARQRKRLKPLGRTKLLGKVAAGHSKSMARRKHCDHHGFEKRARLIEKKTGLSRIAENCYMFPASRYDVHVAKRLVEGWLRSPGHRANLLSPGFRRTGISIVVRRGYVYATQLFTD